MSNERIDIESMEARMRLWAIGDVSDEDLALELDYIVPELKRCYEKLNKANEAMLKAREVLMKHHEWMSVNDATSEEDDQEILAVVKALREA